MLECKDCCLYYTEACRYGRYALAHNMSLNCDDFIVEHNKAYQQGKADAIEEVISLARAEIDFESQAEQKRFVEFMEQLKEQK
mgnify:CR=1 FL=1